MKKENTPYKKWTSQTQLFLYRVPGKKTEPCEYIKNRVPIYTKFLSNSKRALFFRTFYTSSMSPYLHKGYVPICDTSQYIQPDNLV